MGHIEGTHNDSTGVLVPVLVLLVAVVALEEHHVALKITLNNLEKLVILLHYFALYLNLVRFAFCFSS